ncbi:MAG: hypothetical protein QM752_04515 [Gammaproteobacteria bacterium]
MVGVPVEVSNKTIDDDVMRALQKGDWQFFKTIGDEKNEARKKNICRQHVFFGFLSEPDCILRFAMRYETGYELCKFLLTNKDWLLHTKYLLVSGGEESSKKPREVTLRLYDAAFTRQEVEFCRQLDAIFTENFKACKEILFKKLSTIAKKHYLGTLSEDKRNQEFFEYLKQYLSEYLKEKKNKKEKIIQCLSTFFPSDVSAIVTDYLNLEELPLKDKSIYEKLTSIVKKK